MIIAVIGANYGDEGKGLAVNHFTREGNNLVVRHNGGAQSGHTVDKEDMRFVFHELSSGSFNGATTFWDITYHPDLYALGKEYHDFQHLTGKSPKIYCDKAAQITILDDIFLNCFKECNQKAGSCGMGIWECVCRMNAGYGLTINEVKQHTVDTLFERLQQIRKDYSIPRLQQYIAKLANAMPNQYSAMLHDDNMLYNYAYEIRYNAEAVTLVDGLGDIIDQFDNVVFESGQGLLLDGDSDTEHGTPSKTGLFNITKRLSSIGKQLDEAVYVTRTYLTRHGRGQLENEQDLKFTDNTNVYNEWQEGMRYGRFDSIKSLVDRVQSDAGKTDYSILITHMNETEGNFLTTSGDEDINKIYSYLRPNSKIYMSCNPYRVGDTVVTHNGTRR